VTAPQARPGIPAPFGLLAEVTHRCPLGCPYCSNPLALENRSDELNAATWARVFREAAALGVLQVHLSGGEPASRRDLVEIAAAAHAAGLYTNLITSAIGLDVARLARLKEAGLDHVQLSLQDVDAASADRIADYAGAHARKLAFARSVVELGLALTVNAVIHRANIGRVAAMVEQAAALGAGRVEIAHTQYYGWALRNRQALMPTRAQVDQAMQDVEQIRPRYADRLVIDLVVPDYYARRPKACMGGWARRSLNVTPSGRVLPCHAAETIPGLEFWSVQEHSLRAIWLESPAFQAFRGTDWMAEPCRSCALREVDFGGCRCQAMALTGDAAATDPACELSPLHPRMLALAEQDSGDAEIRYAYRGRAVRAGAIAIQAR
jgi:pyrroloquinoline quinone biosynthesis protein E